MPKKNDDHAPATKKDLRDLENRMEQRMKAMEQRMTLHFDTVAENLVHDFQGIFKDRLEQHEDRITRLEEHVGLARK